MSKLTISETMQLRSSLRQELSYYLPEWQLASMYVAPQRFRTPGQKGGKRNDRKIIKNQAGRSLRTFVSGMMNGATPKSRPWFNLTVSDHKKANSSSAKKFFAASEKVLNDHFQISNLYGVLPLSYKDVGVFSNSAFAMLPHPTYGFYFYPFAMGTYAFACDAEGNTNMFTRDFSMSVRQVVETYGKLKMNGQIDWSTLPEWIQVQWKAARYLETVTLTTVIVPNSTYNPASAKARPFNQELKKFQAYTYLQSMGSNIPPQTSAGFRTEQSLGEKEYIRISGYDYFPVITPRWEVQAEDNYGIDGPTQMALSDVMTLQEMEKARLDAVAKLVRPPMVGHASLRRHQASILAGGITYVDDAGASAGFKPAFEIDPKLAELIADQQEYTTSIRSCYYEDLFLMLSQGETKTHISAREIDEKAAERMNALAPVLGQLDLDQNSKIIRNAQIILEGLGRMPERPRELIGENLRPEYISTLHQAAKVAQLNGMERMMNFASSVANATQDPIVLKIFKGEDYVRRYADFMAIPPDLMRDEGEMDDIRQEVAANNQQQLNAQLQAQGAETAKNLSQAELGKGSMLDAMASSSQV